MICEICGKKGARLRRTMQVFGTGKSSYLVENVPVVDCGACCESYVTAKTAKELERIHQHWRELAVKRVVPVAKFGGAA
jgi:YgiT-type zinc finger domain-containing protein